MTSSSAPTLIGSVVKALELLDAISAEPRPSSAKQLAGITGFPLPTTYHLLRTLLHEGYAVKYDGGYVLGDRVSELAHRQRHSRAGQRSRTVLQSLRDTVGAAAYFAALEDGRVRLIDTVDSPRTPRTPMWVGFDEAAHATAIGKAMLSRLPPGQQRAFFATHPLVDLTRSTVTSERVLMQQLQQHRDVATDEQEYALGVACMAVPVPSSSRVCAVAVSVPMEHHARLLTCQGSLRAAAVSLALIQDM